VRTAALEVVRYDHARSKSILVSAWGEREDWYRDIGAFPAAGGHRLSAVCLPPFLTDEWLYGVFSEYARAHWLAARFLYPLPSAL
jgi:hypothetical protein